MNFYGEAKEWYSCFRVENPDPPWQILVEAVCERFKRKKGCNAVVLFHKVCQTSSVEEYIRVFEKAKCRLLAETSIKNEYFYMWSFISGLKEELQNTITLFKPQTLNEAFSVAQELEVVVGPTDKEPVFIKPQNPQILKNNNNPNEMGTRKWCNDKWFQGHRCGKGLHALDGEETEEGQRGPEMVSQEEGKGSEEEEIEGVEHEVVTLSAPIGTINNRTLKYKGMIGNIPICALIDSGSTHSFIQPSLVQSLNLAAINTNPLYVKGYDVILGVDWLSSFGDMIMNWAQGKMVMNHGGKEVKLINEMTKAEVRICEGALNPVKEKKNGSQIIYAQLFTIEETQPETKPEIHPFLLPILQEFQMLFEEPKTLPPKRPIDHQIVLKPDSKPVNQRPYRFSYFQKLEIEKIIQELLKNNLIQHNTSSYSSPVLLVKKKDGTWRMCIDYRRLNDDTVKNKFPIPIIDDLLDELDGAHYFSKLDLRSGYHQIRMSEEDIHKTAFTTHEGLYEFKVMPCGLTNAPATFQTLMNLIFKPYLRKFILVFFDDILVYSRDLDSHAKHLKLALETLKHNQMFVKMSKCEFGVNQLEYLGHIISKSGVATDPAKVEAMLHWPVPKSIKELRGFLGLTGYYRKFIQGYGFIAQPLTELLKKNAFKWSQGAQMAFESLKQAMVTAPVLKLPDFGQPFYFGNRCLSNGYWCSFDAR
ncbi:uncharacterized protein LOC144545634 [Carex rostrata]